jgi:Protein of unknown function (DUF2892)
MGLPRSLKHLPPTAIRVEQSTCSKVNRLIQEKTRLSIRRAAATPSGIDRRLLELDREWDIERALQTNFGVVTLAGVTLGALAAAPWFIFAGIAGAFMAEHALKGWCPPVPVFRRLGFRTAREINHERYALKALRGELSQ